MSKKSTDTFNEKKDFLRYFFVIFFCIGTILLGTIGFLYNLESKDYLKRVEIEEEVNLKQQIRLIKSNFESIVSDLRFLSKENELIRMIDYNETKYRSWISNEYLELIKKKSFYDQIRYLDEKGMELVRVNYKNGKPVVVKNDKLQFKGDRYYFKDTFALGQNKIYVSPLDLNVEKGEIEKPLKPMIRFGIPVSDKFNKKRGVIIINYLGSKLIDTIKEISQLSLGDIMFINSDGYWLHSPKKEDLWGFMIKERYDRKFQLKFPEEWNHITKSDFSQIYNDKGLFTSATIYPLNESFKSSTGSTLPYGDSVEKLKSSQYYWKLVSHVSNKNLRLGTRGLFVKLLILAGFLFIIGAVPAWIIAKSIVRRKLFQLELHHSANYDKLTDLPNRSLFHERLGQAVQQSSRYNRKFALMFIDLDGFKSVNDNLGHDVGDQVLIQTAERLLQCIRNSDTVARIGGDEFVIILNSISENKNIESIAKKIISSLSKPFNTINSEASIGSSIGISTYPEDGEDVETLLKKADEAMYMVKNSGKNSYKFSS
jgi:diguanylate cyclase (GGDEF)-like protein